MLRSPSSTSTKTGVAPLCRITFTVAGQVIVVVTTSSPGPTPSATSARWRAAVPDASASTCSASRYSLIRRSSSAARGPVVSQPERSVSATAAISSSPTAGGWKPSIVSRRAETSCIAPAAYLRPPSGLLQRRLDRRRLEADEFGGAVGLMQRLVARLADREDRARTVRAADQRAELVT